MWAVPALAVVPLAVVTAAVLLLVPAADGEVATVADATASDALQWKTYRGFFLHAGPAVLWVGFCNFMISTHFAARGDEWEAMSTWEVLTKDARLFVYTAIVALCFGVGLLLSYVEVPEIMGSASKSWASHIYWAYLFTVPAGTAIEMRFVLDVEGGYVKPLFLGVVIGVVVAHVATGVAFYMFSILYAAYELPSGWLAQAIIGGFAIPVLNTLARQALVFVFVFITKVAGTDDAAQPSSDGRHCKPGTAKLIPSIVSQLGVDSAAKLLLLNNTVKQGIGRGSVGLLLAAATEIATIVVTTWAFQSWQSRKVSLVTTATTETRVAADSTDSAGDPESGGSKAADEATSLAVQLGRSRDQFTASKVVGAQTELFAYAVAVCVKIWWCAYAGKCEDNWTGVVALALLVAFAAELATDVCMFVWLSLQGLAPVDFGGERNWVKLGGNLPRDRLVSSLGGLRIWNRPILQWGQLMMLWMASVNHLSLLFSVLVWLERRAASAA